MGGEGRGWERGGERGGEGEVKGGKGNRGGGKGAAILPHLPQLPGYATDTQ